MNDTLKVAGRIGAELGAAKAECERLRDLLRDVEFRGVLTGWEPGLIGQITAALSQQAEPNHAEDMRAMVEPALAQDEREASRSVEPIVRALNASVAVGSDGDWVSIRREHRDAAVRMLSDLDADFRHVYQAYAEAQKRANRPAQTEQQPFTVPDGYALVPQTMHLDKGVIDALLFHVGGLDGAEEEDKYVDGILWVGEVLGDDGEREAYGLNIACAECPEEGSTNLIEFAAPIAQTAPLGKFRMGDLVKKSTGSEWEGHICGTYSTELTPEGYAVESSAHRNSVQIYPAKALEAVE